MDTSRDKDLLNKMWKLGKKMDINHDIEQFLQK